MKIKIFCVVLLIINIVQGVIIAADNPSASAETSSARPTMRRAFDASAFLSPAATRTAVSPADRDTATDGSPLVSNTSVASAETSSARPTMRRAFDASAFLSPAATRTAVSPADRDTATDEAPLVSNTSVASAETSSARPTMRRAFDASAFLVPVTSGVPFTLSLPVQEQQKAVSPPPAPPPPPGRQVDRQIVVRQVPPAPPPPPPGRQVGAPPLPNGGIMAALAGLNRDNPMEGLKKVKAAEVGALPVNEREARLASIRTEDPAARLRQMREAREAREATASSSHAAAQLLTPPVNMFASIQRHLKGRRQAIDSDDDSDDNSDDNRKNGKVYAKMIFKEMLDDERFDDVEVKKLIQKIKMSQLDEWDEPIEKWSEAKLLPSEDEDSIAVQEYKRYWNAKIATLAKSVALRRQQPAAVVMLPPPAVITAPPTSVVATPVVTTPAAIVPADLPPPLPVLPLSPPPTALQSPIAIAQASSPRGDGIGIVDIDTWAELEFQREKKEIQVQIDALNAIDVNALPLRERAPKRSEISRLMQPLSTKLSKYNNEFAKGSIISDIKKRYPY